jgi:hypothetical protein
MSRLIAPLERLGEEIERMAERDARKRGRGGRARRALPLSRRAIVLALLTLVVLAAAAVAATTGLLTGEPLKPSGEPHLSPKRGSGVARLETVRLTALRVGDPGGGPPWGLRTFRTTRGAVCVQVGRVVDGRLGVLGQDGAVNNDGRFHALAAEVSMGTDCQTTDAAGHGFLAIGVQGTPASGLRIGSCTVQQGVTRTPACPERDVRILFYGLLGPRATAVTYRDRGIAHTARTAGPDGAYLVVLRPSRQHPAKGYWSIGVSPGSGLSSVRYRGAPTCHIGDPRRLGGAGGCPLVGYVVRHADVTTADVATAVHARLAPGTHRAPAPPPNVHAPRSRMRTLTLTFRARVATHGAAEGYVATVELHHRHGCRSSYGTFLTTDGDVRAGEVVRLHTEVPASCRATVEGTVTYRRASRPQPGPAIGNPVTDPRVGTFSLPIGR